MAGGTADPVSKNFQSTLDTAEGKRKVNRSPEFIREKFANDACPITRLLRNVNRRTADLLPFDNEPIKRSVS
jgi:hypothetical protein